MTRRIVSIIAFSGLVALDVGAQPSEHPHAHPAAPGAAKQAGEGAKPKGPAGAGMGQKGPESRQALKDQLTQPAPQLAERAEKLRERAKELRGQGKERAAEGLEKQAERLTRRAEGGESVEDPKQTAENRAKIRRARKMARIKLLDRRYGESLNQGDVREEIEQHARRSANLSRMKSLAGQESDEAKKQELLKRINRLMARENARHSRTMAKLTKKDQLTGKSPAVPTPSKAADEPTKDSKEGQE